MYSKHFTARDLDVMARTIYGEARGEGVQGMQAVGWVIRNRSEIDLWGDGRPDWWGETIQEVCFKKWQFSCWNFGDPNRIKLVKLSTLNPMYKLCLNAAAAVLVENLPADPTKGACHYHHIRLRPDWATEAQPSLRLFNHLFYAGIK